MEELLRIVATVSALIVTFSWVAVLVPGLGGIDRSGFWQGLFIHKNLLGREMAIAVLVWGLCLYFRRTNRVISVLILLLSGSLLALSGSITSLVMVFIAMLSVPVLRFVLSQVGGLGTGLIAAGFTLWFGIPHLNNIYVSLVGGLGRGTNLTGRDRIWELVSQAIAERPLLGYGLGGFWLGWSTGPASDLLSKLGFLTYHSHNGFLDILLAMGVVGFTLFLITLIYLVVRSVSRLSKGIELTSVFPIQFTIFLVGYNLVETSLISQISWFWIIYVALYSSLRLDDLRANNLQSVY